MNGAATPVGKAAPPVGGAPSPVAEEALPGAKSPVGSSSPTPPDTSSPVAEPAVPATRESPGGGGAVLAADAPHYSANLRTHRPGISHREMVEAYDEWAQDGKYEDVSEPGGGGHAECVTIHTLCPSTQCSDVCKLATQDVTIRYA